MAIMRKIETKGNKLVWFVDLGYEIDDFDDDDEASEAYVFMLTCLEQMEITNSLFFLSTSHLQQNNVPN
jgi:hypothetical protein